MGVLKGWCGVCHSRKLYHYLQSMLKEIHNINGFVSFGRSVHVINWHEQDVYTVDSVKLEPPISTGFGFSYA